MERGWGHTWYQGCLQAGRGEPGQRLLLHEGGTERPTPKYKDGHGVVGLRGVLADQAGSYTSEPVGCFFPDPPLGIFRALLGHSSQAAEEFSPWAPFPQGKGAVELSGWGSASGSTGCAQGRLSA